MGNLLRELYDNIERRKVLLLTLIIILVLVIEVGCTVAIPLWKEYFFNGVEQKEMNVYLTGLGYFVALFSGFALAQSIKGFMQKTVGLALRKGMVKVLKRRWYSDLKNKSDNPDQRIAEDSWYATDAFLSLLMECVISAAIVIILVFTMSHGSIYVLISAIVYTIASIFVAHLFYRPMINRDKALQRQEADFRYGLAKVRFKKEFSKVSFKGIQEKYTAYIRILFGYSLFKRFQGNLTPLIPYLILIPLFFYGNISFGEVMGGVSAFELMIANTTVILQLYPDLTKSIAAWERILSFYRGVKDNV